MKTKIYNRALKETIHYRKTSEETGGKYSELEISLEPRGGNPLHIHKSYTELFTVISGRLGIELLNGKEVLLVPGESYLVRKGEPHRFFNIDDTNVTFTNRVEPGSKGLEDTLRILCGLSEDGLYSKVNIPRNPLHIAVCGEMSDMWLAGWKGKISDPLIKLLAWVACKRGVKEKLVKKYCI